MGLPRVRQEEGDVSFFELSGQSSVCCLGWAPRIEGNPVVPELGFFFSFVPSPAPLSPCDLFGLKISFPNSLRAAFLFFLTSLLLQECFGRAGVSLGACAKHPTAGGDVWEGKGERKGKELSLMVLCDTGCGFGDTSALWGCSGTPLTLLGDRYEW